MVNTISFEDRCSEIQLLIAEDNIQRAVRRLMDFVRDFCEDSSLVNDVILISANFKSLERETRLSLIDYNQAQVRKSQLLNSMLELFSNVSDNQDAPQLDVPVNYATAPPPRHTPTEPPPARTTIPKAETPTTDSETNPQASSVQQPVAVNEPPITDPPQPIKTVRDSPPPPSRHSEIFFRSEKLGKTYKSTGFSLNDINISLEAGEITGLVGENGNGKTTFFEVITGNLKHDKGSISYPALNNGKKIKWDKVKKQIAYVTQELRPMHGSLLDNIYYEAACHGVPSRKIKKEVEFMIHRMGLTEHVDKKWGQLSGGYKLRFSLTTALIWKPRLLVLDEPLANLDINAQLLVLNDLRDLARSPRFPMSVIISSQHLHEIENVSDKIIFLRNGEVIYYGDKKGIGADRDFNTFEIITSANRNAIDDSLTHVKVNAIEFDGFHYIITTPRSVSSHEVMKALCRKDIEIKYFRDISQSTKKLFL